MNPLALTRLLQMASQAFPIGGYSHSQGLESAIDSGAVEDEASVQHWITDALRFSVAAYELPCLNDMSAAWSAQRVDHLCRLNDEFLATRESAELRGATVQMGFSMRTLVAALPGLPHMLDETLRMMREPSLPCVWSGLACAWSIAAADSMAGYAWAWAENQVLVAMKAVPIGQSSGQRILLHIGGQISALDLCCDSGDSGPRSNFAPGLAILSCRHETQYSRLFRS